VQKRGRGKIREGADEPAQMLRKASVLRMRISDLRGKAGWNSGDGGVGAGLRRFFAMREKTWFVVP